MTGEHRNYIGFKEYINSRKKIPDTAEGDFIKDAQSDGDLPDVKNWQELSDYLYYNHASQIICDVLVAAKIVWRKYRAKYPAY